MENISDFQPILQATLTPIALISGVGLLLLSMVNRYNHAIDRVRQLLKERPSRSIEELPKLEASIAVIFRRCRVMRNAILCVASSIVASGAIVFVTAVEGFAGIDAYIFKALLLILSIGLVVAAAIMFVIEITYSLHALEMELPD